MDPLVDETGQPYAYTGDDPVNGTDPLGLCSTSGGTFLVSGACHWTSRSWVSQTENTLQSQKGGGFSITNGLKAVADYGAGFGNAVVSTVTLGHVHVAPPYCGFGWASDVGMGYGFVALTLLSGGSGGAGEVADGAETVEEVEAGAQASSAAESEGPAIKAGSSGGETAGKAFPQSVRQAALDENPDTCVYCQMDTDSPQVDHAVPRAQGGNATIDNAQTTCGWCNASKGAREFPVNPPPDYEGSWPPPWWNNVGS